MGDRRMFSSKVILSDDFLDLPATARCLYFTLNMFADDDGFLNNHKTVMRMCNASQNDFDILILKRYLVDFNNGVIVIRHWGVHNLIRSDRYKPTTFENEKSMLVLNEDKSYGLGLSALPEATECDSENEMDTIGIPLVSTSKDKLSKDKLSKTIDADFEVFWNAYPKHRGGKEAALKAFKKVKVPVETLIKAVEQQKLSEQWTHDNGKYIPYPATWLNQGRWEDEVEQVNPCKNRNIDVEDLPEIRRPQRSN